MGKRRRKKKSEQPEDKQLPAKTNSTPVEVLEVDRADYLRQRNREIIHQIGENCYELGQNLYEILHGEHYKEWDYASFEEYCQLELGYSLWKARDHIAIWEKFDQKLGIPWEVHSDSSNKIQLKNVGWTKVRLIEPLVETKKDANTWLKTAMTNPKPVLEQMVRDEKKKRRGEKTRSKIEDVEFEEELEEAADSETPYADEPTTGDQLLVEEDEDEDTDDDRRIRMTFMVSRAEYSHILAAMERVSQVTGEKHPGKILDLMAADSNTSLAESGTGAAHLLSWHVKTLERIFDVQVTVNVPRNSRLRKMSRVSDGAEEE